MRRAAVLMGRVKYESERDNLPCNVDERIISQLLFAANKEQGIDINGAGIRMVYPSVGWLYGNIEVVSV